MSGPIDTIAIDLPLSSAVNKSTLHKVNMQNLSYQLSTNLLPAATVIAAEPPRPAKKRKTINWTVFFANADPILKARKMTKKLM